METIKKSVLYILLFGTLFGLFYDSKAALVPTINDNRNDTESLNKTTSELKNRNIRCYACTSWKNAGCGDTLQESLNQPVYCISSHCIKMDLWHKGKKEVIRGCTSDTSVQQYTCNDKNLCNIGHSLKAVWKTFCLSILCSIFILL